MVGRFRRLELVICRYVYESSFFFPCPRDGWVLFFFVLARGHEGTRGEVYRDDWHSQFNHIVIMLRCLCCCRRLFGTRRGGLSSSPHLRFFLFGFISGLGSGGSLNQMLDAVPWRSRNCGWWSRKWWPRALLLSTQPVRPSGSQQNAARFELL